MKKACIVLLTAFGKGASSFSTSHNAASRSKSLNTALHLLPTQGNQLAAASNAALAKERREDGAPALEEHRTGTAEPTPTNAARQFAARLFSLPSRLQKHKSSSIPELVAMSGLFDAPYKRSGDEVDVVLYPITGFRWVKGSDEYKVLPTTTTAACSLPNLPNRLSEELVGWYSPACMLGSLHSIDDSDYCWERRDSTISTLE